MTSTDRDGRAGHADRAVHTDRVGEDGPRVTRRAVVVAGSGVLLAACAGGGTNQTAGPSSAGPTATTAGGTGGAKGDGTAKGGSGGAPIARLDDIQVGGAAIVTDAEGTSVVVARPTAGQVAGFSTVCTHQGCTVALAGKVLQCPCHGSEFDALTGKVLQGPATVPLPSVAVKISGSQVVQG